MRRQGFTMIELLTVISIIAVLAAILFPTFARARETARRSSCASNLEQIGIALNSYAQAYDGHYPRRNNEFSPIYRYAGSIDVFYCPDDPAEHRWEFKSVKRKNAPEPLFFYDETYKVPVRTYSSYVYKGGMTNDDRADTPIASEAVVWHGDLANVLYIGGHVRSVPSDTFEPVVPQTKKPVVNQRPNPYGPEPTPGAPPPDTPPPGAPAPAKGGRI